MKCPGCGKEKVNEYGVWYCPRCMAMNYPSG